MALDTDDEGRLLPREQAIEKARKFLDGLFEVRPMTPQQAEARLQTIAAVKAQFHELDTYEGRGWR